MQDHTPIYPENITEYAPWVAKHGLRYAYGMCQCGCGEAAPIAKSTTSKKRGLVKGFPVRYVRGHQGRYPPQDGPNPSGKCLCGCGQKTALAHKTSIKTGLIKGKPVRFIAGHGNREPLRQRFWGKVEKNGPIHPILRTPCWMWTASKGTGGYGKVSVDGRHTKATRVVWRLIHGEIPKGMYVCHRCDNPGCVNPHHLFLGTHLDNMLDMKEKNRSPIGERAWQAKLNEHAVMEIRRLWKEGVNLSDLGRRFGVAPATIRDVVHYKTWRHVP